METLVLAVIIVFVLALFVGIVAAIAWYAFLFAIWFWPAILGTTIALTFDDLGYGSAVAIVFLAGLVGNIYWLYRLMRMANHGSAAHRCGEDEHTMV